MKATKFFSLLSIFVLIGFITNVKAQNKTDGYKTKPAVKQEAVQQSEVSSDDIVSAVEQYIAEEVKNGDGFFIVNDPNYETPLQCSLVKIHKGSVHNVGNGEYFVCADFKSNDGKEYDIDIFVKGDSKDNLKESRTLIHKENGVERYTWIEENGLWRMGDAEQNETSPEKIIEDESSVK